MPQVNRYQEQNGRTLSIAAIQMFAQPSPLLERLERAGILVEQAANSGAKLVVLPELFNTGYSYSASNHHLVETIDGTTASWMAENASRLGIHLAGTLMLLDKEDAFNSLLLFAPDGRHWRYDKVYPWGWERGSYRDSIQQPKTTIASTDLGDIGLLICWDSSHLNLWQMYAGRVDLLLISSCSPNIGESIYHFRTGDRLAFEDMGRSAEITKGSVAQVFGPLINKQVAWLGVPAVNATTCGQLETDIPQGRLTLLGFALSAPRLLKYLPVANELSMSCELIPECKILDASGKVLARLSNQDGEAYIQAEVHLATYKPSPQTRQPDSGIPWQSYFFSDTFIPTVMKPMYRKGKQKWKGKK